MKKYLLVIGLCLLTVSASAQWLTEMSCDKQSKRIANQAITHLLNIEGAEAVGMAKAALMIDKNCGTAQLVIVNSTLSNEYGTRKRKRHNNTLMFHCSPSWELPWTKVARTD